MDQFVGFQGVKGENFSNLLNGISVLFDLGIPQSQHAVSSAYTKHYIPIR